MKKKLLSLDLPLSILTIILSILGLITFFSASYIYSLKNFQNPYFYFQRFLLRVTFFGFLFFLVGNFLGSRFNNFKKLFLFIFFVLYFFLFLGFLPPFKIKETARWVNLGFFSFQPSELIKPFAIFFFIFVLSFLKKTTLFHSTIIFIVFSFFLIAPIYFQPALSNSLIILSSLLAIFLFFVFASPFKYKNNLFSFFLIILFFSVIILASFIWGYRLERIWAFLTQGELYKERYFQLEQSLLGISSGGLKGKGLGKSEIKILGLPQMLTDSIFVIYAEETGFIGSLIVLFLYFLLILRIILLGINETFEKSAFTLGTAVWLSFQIFLHIASNTGLIVPTGVVLPFFSYGASAQLAIYFSLGIISSFKK